MLDLIGYSTVPDDATVAATRLDQFLGWLMTVPWWVVFGFALVSTMWLMWVSWPRSALTTKEFPPGQGSVFNREDLIAINGKFFSNERVVLDGKSFVNCVFEACTIVYNGSEKIWFSNNALRAPIQIQSDVPEIQRMMVFLHQLGMLAVPFRDQNGNFVTPAGLTVINEAPQNPQPASTGAETPP